MEIKSSEPGPRPTPDQQEIGLNNTGELNLYLDLLAFSEMSPENQLADREQHRNVTPDPVFQSPAEFPGFVATDDPFDGILSSNETSEHLLESQVFDSLPEPLEAEPLGCDPPAFLEPEATADPVFEFLHEGEQLEAAAPVDAPAPTIVTADLSPRAVEANDMFRASGPLSLSGLLFDPALKSSAHIVSLVFCTACGSEADAEDMICLACGTFIDERGADEAARDGSSELVCGDCGLVVATGELICPACGTFSPVC
jgi:hypothetical protein